MHSSAPNAEQAHWVDRGWYLVTEFERTPSINFPRAIELSQAHPEFTPLMDERNIMIYRNIYRPEHLLLFHEMFRLIKNWKGAKLYIKGERVAFDMLGMGIQCYCQTVLSRIPPSQTGCQRFSKETSLGCLGCRRSYVSMEWDGEEIQEIPTWFAFGRLDQHQVYRIHKENLESAVIGELIEYHYCPLIDLDEIRRFIQSLPDRIDPRKDREWCYTERVEAEERPSMSPLRLAPGASRQPSVIPVSADAYRIYLKALL